jgi:hypothetical protein
MRILPFEMRSHELLKVRPISDISLSVDVEIETRVTEFQFLPSACKSNIFLLSNYFVQKTDSILHAVAFVSGEFDGIRCLFCLIRWLEFRYVFTGNSQELMPANVEWSRECSSDYFRDSIDGVGTSNHLLDMNFGILGIFSEFVYSPKSSILHEKLERKSRLVNECDFENCPFGSNVSNFRRFLESAGGCRSKSRIEISSSVEIIHANDFCRCTDLTEVLFPRDCIVKAIDGFIECISLSRIVIPSSVEIIDLNGFF